MSNWLKMDPKSPRCCSVSIALRKGRPDPLSKEGGRVTCSECGKVWIRVGDEIRLAE